MNTEIRNMNKSFVKQKRSILESIHSIRQIKVNDKIKARIDKDRKRKEKLKSINKMKYRPERKLSVIIS